MKKVYIAGKVSGIPIEEVREKFAKAEEVFASTGYKAFNPVEYVQEYNKCIVKSGGVALTDERNRKEIMKICWHELLDCDAIYLLSDFVNSPGACSERDIAVAAGLEIIYETKKIKKNGKKYNDHCRRIATGRQVLQTKRPHQNCSAGSA